MIGVGIAWASILSMPYAILSGALPSARMGVYMGIFNFFIVIPEILASLALGPIVKNLFGNDPVKVVMMMGGASMLIAALLTQWVNEPAENPETLQQITEQENMLESITPPEPAPAGLELNCTVARK